MDVELASRQGAVGDEVKGEEKHQEGELVKVRLAPVQPASTARAETVVDEIRWPLLFKLYRPVNLPGMRRYALIELVLVFLFFAGNIAYLLPKLIAIGMGSEYSCFNGDCRNAYKMERAAHDLAILGCCDYLLLFVAAMRNSIIGRLVGLPFERAIQYHQVAAQTMIAVFLCHGVGMLSAFWYQSALIEKAFDSLNTYSNGSGEIALIAALLIYFTSLGSIRRRCFDLFLRLHWLLFLTFIAFGIIHMPLFWKFSCGTLSAWALDWILRVYVWKKPVTVLSAKALPGNVVRLDFKVKDLSYHPGQYIFVCIPAVSPWEWHPFSLSSSPHHDTLTLHIRVLGDWTRRLREVLEGYERGGEDIQLGMYVEGPYGQLALPLYSFTNVLLVCGGIGITPMISVFNALAYDAAQQHRKLDSCTLAWNVREPALVDSLFAVHATKISHERGKPSRAGFLLPPTGHLLDLVRDADAATDGAKEARLEAGGDGGPAPVAALPAAPDMIPAVLRDRVHAVVYLTGGADAGVAAALASQSADKSVVKGRMDVAAVIDEARRAAIASANPTLAVLVCGPSALVDECADNCATMSRPECTISLHFESFEF